MLALGRSRLSANKALSSATAHGAKPRDARPAATAAPLGLAHGHRDRETPPRSPVLPTHREEPGRLQTAAGLPDTKFCFSG